MFQTCAINNVETKTCIHVRQTQHFEYGLGGFTIFQFISDVFLPRTNVEPIYLLIVNQFIYRAITRHHEVPLGQYQEEMKPNSPPDLSKP